MSRIKYRPTNSPNKKENYQQLHLIGNPNRVCKVDDRVFLTESGMLGTPPAPNFKGQPRMPKKNDFTPKLNLYTGQNLKTMFDRPNKKANNPLFKPIPEPYLLNRNDVMNNYNAQAFRYKDDTGFGSRNFEMPVDPIKVPPGLDIGYNNEGDDRPFHPWYRPPEYTVDELRGEVRPTYDIEGRTNIGQKNDKMYQKSNYKSKRREAIYGLNPVMNLTDTTIFGSQAPQNGTLDGTKISGVRNPDSVQYFGNQLIGDAVNLITGAFTNLFGNSIRKTERLGQSVPIVYVNECGHLRGEEIRRENKKQIQVVRDQPQMVHDIGIQIRGQDERREIKKHSDITRTGNYDLNGLGSRIIEKFDVKETRFINYSKKGAPVNLNKAPTHQTVAGVKFGDKTVSQRISNRQNITNERVALGQNTANDRHSFTTMKQYIGNKTSINKGNHNSGVYFAPTTKRENIEHYTPNANAVNPKQYKESDTTAIKQSRNTIPTNVNNNGCNDTGNKWSDTKYIGVSTRMANDGGPRPFPDQSRCNNQLLQGENTKNQKKYKGMTEDEINLSLAARNRQFVKPTLKYRK